MPVRQLPEAVINRMGFNNHGLEAAKRRLETLRRNGIVGVNNHMGSRATADARVMRSVLRSLPAGLYFIDSPTSDFIRS